MNWQTSSGSNPSWESLLPLQSIALSHEHMDQYFYYVRERNLIWYRRNVLKLPREEWTNDPILKNFRFTNVYRELDRNSQWEIKNIILDEHNQSNLEEMLFKIIMFRLINNPEFFEWIIEKDAALPDIDTYNPSQFGDYLREYRLSSTEETNLNPYTSAYLINTLCCKDSPYLHDIGGGQRDYCFSRVILPYVKDNVRSMLKSLKACKTADKVAQIFCQIPSVAMFVANEIYCSISYVKKYTEVEIIPFSDDDWTNVGPGCSLGIRLIYPSARGAKEQYQRIKALKAWGKIKLINFDFQYVYWDKEQQKYYTKTGIENYNLGLHSHEFCLCEYSKYWKMQIGQGKQRSLFTPK